MVRYLVTAALLYGNGPLHLGHLRSTYLPGDIYVRFLRMNKEDVLFICATDEHGTPIVVNAEKSGKKPKEIVDYYHEYNKKMFDQLGVSFDSYHRTSSKENVELTQHFFKRMKENGCIDERDVEQLYCEKCKRALPDRLVLGTCPYCGAEKQYGDQCEKCGHVLKGGSLINPHCAICDSVPVLKKSKHYFFTLRKFSDKLKKWITENKQFQNEVKNYVVNWIDSGLHDWDITRDMDWGIKVPGADHLVFYVWFDAPIGYISSTIACTNEWEKYWKNDECKIVHFIGKDISYHHYLFWPAMLMSVDERYTLPYAIPVRGYLNLEGKKFSKSKGWYVSAEEFLSMFPADYIRFYETMITPYSPADADFYWKDFMSRINNELVANIGNFVYRTLSMIKRSGLQDFEYVDPKIKDRTIEYSNKISENMYSFKFKESLDLILSLSSELNAYLSANEPWKKDGEEKQKILSTALYGVHCLSIMLYPFIPHAANEIRRQLGKGEPYWEEINKTPAQAGITSVVDVKPIFGKIDSDTIKKLEEKLHKRQI